MAKSQLIAAKESVLKVLKTHRSPVLGNPTVSSDDAYDKMSKRVWEAAEAYIKQSYRNGITEGRNSIANRNLLDVSHYMCARLTAMAEIMATNNSTSYPLNMGYARHVIAELAETLQRMPFTDEEGALVHRTLEPLVRKYGAYHNSSKMYQHDWMMPLIEALEKVPGKQTPELSETPS